MKWIKASERLPVGIKKAVNIFTDEVGEIAVNKDSVCFNDQFTATSYTYKFDDPSLYSNIIWLDENIDAEGGKDGARTILAELVELKEIKDMVENMPASEENIAKWNDYKKRKPLVWERAKKFLSTPKEAANEDELLEQIILDISVYYNGTPDQRTRFSDIDIHLPAIKRKLKSKYKIYKQTKE